MSFGNILSISVLAVATAGFASAGPLLYDDFNYPIGQSLDGQNGGTGWASEWQGAPDLFYVAAGSLSYPNLVQSGNRAQFIQKDESSSNVVRQISSLGGDGSTFWFSFLMSVDGPIGQNDAYVSLMDSLGRGDLEIGRELPDQTDWGVFSGRDNSTTPFLSSIPIVPGQDIFVAVEIDLNANPTLNDTVNIYFDPNPATTSGAAPGVPAITFTSYNFLSAGTTLGFDGIGASNTPSGFVANFDPIRGGTTYYDVAPATSSTSPEPATWSFMAGGLAVLAVAVRRRATRR